MNVYEMFLLDPSNFYLDNENEVKMTDKLPWKSVNDHPLPEGDGACWYLLTLSNDDCAMSLTPKSEYHQATHWCRVDLPKPEKPSAPQIELWSVWENSENKFYIVYENYQGRTDRFKVWDLSNCTSLGILSLKDLKYSFTHRPDLEVRAPALLKHGCGIEPSVYVNQIESENYSDFTSLTSIKLYKWPASLAQMIVVKKEK